MDGVQKDLERFGALSRILERWAAKAEISYIKSWQENSALGFSNEHFTIVERGLGYAVALKKNGETKTVFAPTPFA